jgi:hypothetical protein
MTTQAGRLLSLVLPTGVPDGLPPVFDNMSFALSLGLQNRTVWWLIHAAKIERMGTPRGAYYTFEVPKKSGGTRLIHAPRKTLKRVQRVLLQTYFDKLPVGDHVGAYVLGRDMVYSVNKHAGKDVVISLDLKDFFGSTKRKWVREWMYSLGYCTDVVIPMSGLVTVPVQRKKYVSYVVPQGAPTSGAVTNHVATRRLDTPLLAFLRQSGLKHMAYTRYADDLTISFDGFLPDLEFKTLMAGIRQAVSDSGYRLNHKKTRVAVSRPNCRGDAHGTPQRMLGMSIHQKPNVPRSKRRLLRARVHRMVTTRAASIAGGFKTARLYNEEMDSLKAELAYWARISPQTIQPLYDQLRAVGDPP